MINRGNYRYILVGILILFAFVLIKPSFTGFVSLDESSEKVEDNVVKDLKKNEFAEVIIILNEPNDKKPLKSSNEEKEEIVEKIEKKKKKIKDMQGEVLAKIDHINGTKNPSNKSANLITGLFVADDPDLKVKRLGVMANTISGEVSKKGLKKLQKDPNVKKIIKNYKFELYLAESVPLVNATDVHSLNINGVNIEGSGETICIIDSGIDYGNPDLGSCDNDTFIAGNCGKVIAGYDFVDNDNDPMDEDGHGTHCGGIAAASGASSVTGVAPKANLVSVRACNNSVCELDPIIDSLAWCTEYSSLYNISVISMSLGAGSYNSVCDSSWTGTEFPEKINNATEKGIISIAASGNDGLANGISAPACFSNVTSVASVTKADDYYSNSNVASILDILAPGVSIVSTWIGSGTSSLTGTSMATPHVAGAAALLQQYSRAYNNETLPPEEIKKLIKDGGMPKNFVKQTYNYTFPRLDVMASLNLILKVNNTGNYVEDKEKKGRIKFSSSVNLSIASVAFVIKDNLIALDASKYPELNVSANLTLLNLTFYHNPVPMKDRELCDDCEFISYDGENFSFSVTGFSNYTAGPNSQLEIFDQVDQSIIARTYQDVNFFANYTNITSGIPISSGSCNISFSDGLNSSMQHGSGIFNFTRTFNVADQYSYNIKCNDSNFETLNTTDEITILPSCKNSTGEEVSQPLPNIDWVISNDNVTCNNANIYFQNQSLILGENSKLVISNSSFILNSSEEDKELLINKTGSIYFINSLLQSDVTGNYFNLVNNGYAFIYNSTFNSSIFYSNENTNVIKSSSLINTLSINGTAKSNINDSKIFGDFFCDGNSINLIHNSTFNAESNFLDNSTTIIKSSNFTDRMIFFEDSYTEISDSIINDIQFGYLSGTPVINFTLPGSNVSQIYRIRRTNPTVYGYVDFPDSLTDAFQTLAYFNRYYPVHVNYTNGTPATGVRVNITNGTHILFSGLTDSEGFVNPNLTWTSTNKDFNYTIYINPSQNISLLEDTPIIFTLSAVPEVNLISPPDDELILINDSNSTDVMFNYTVVDEDNSTLNCSIFIDSLLNQTNSSTSNNTLSTFIINLAGGTYEWYVQCSDGQNTEISETRNLTIGIVPVVNLINPADEAKITPGTNWAVVEFNYTGIDDNQTLNCSIYLDGILNETNETVDSNSVSSFDINLTGGNYSWFVNCTDGRYSSISETWNFVVQNCGDGIVSGTEECDGTNLSGESCYSLGYDKGTLSCTASCTYTGCSNDNGGGSGGGGGGSGPVIPPKIDENNTESIEEEETIVEDVVEATKTQETKPAVIQKPQEFSEPEAEMAGNKTGVIIWGAILAAIAIILLPILLAGRKCFAEETVIKKLIEKEKLNDYRRLNVIREVNNKYSEILKKKDKINNLVPLKLKKKDFKKIIKIKEEFNVSEEFAKLIAVADRTLFPKMLIIKEVDEKIRKSFRKIKFERI